MRKPLSVFSAAVLFLVVCVLVFWRLIVLPDYWKQLAVALTLLSIGILYWGWRPEINRKLAERNEPKLTIAPADLSQLKEEERIKELEVRLIDGKTRKCGARFYYITVRNSGKKTAEDVTAYCPGELADLMVFMPLRRRSALRVDYNRTSEGFDEETKERYGESYIFALLTDYKFPRTINISPGPKGETFVLFFTLECFRVPTVPGASRIYPTDKSMPCTVMLPIYTQGKNMSYRYTAAFKVNLKKWNDIEVEQVVQTQREALY
jgi:hypothetical protein